MLHDHRYNTESDRTVLATILWIPKALWDVLRWLLLDWSLEDNQSIVGLIVAKLGALFAIGVGVGLAGALILYIFARYGFLLGY